MAASGAPRAFPARSLATDDVDAPHRFLDPRHRRGRDAELPHAESEEHRHGALVARELAAHGDEEVVSRRRARRGDQREHPGIQRVGQRGQLVVAALGRQRVLGEVVGADREEVDVRGEGRRLQRGGRHLDHDPDAQSCGRTAPDDADGVVEQADVR